MVYRAARADALRINVLDTLTALYHRASGQTHVVAEPVPQILAALAEGEADLPKLAARLNLALTDETSALLGERLEELIATGLVSRR